MRVLCFVAAAVVALAIPGRPTRAGDEAHVELGQDIEHEADPEWLRLACPNYVADEAKRRQAAERRAVRDAAYAIPPAMGKCERVLAGGRP